MFGKSKNPITSHEIIPLPRGYVFSTRYSQYVALSNTKLVELKDPKGITFFPFETKETYSKVFSSPHAAKKHHITFLPHDRFAIAMADRVDILCSKKENLIDSIELPVPDSMGILKRHIEQMKVSLDGAYLLVHLRETSEQYERTGVVRNYKSFVFIIDLNNANKIVCIPISPNSLNVSFVNHSRLAVILDASQGIQFYDFNCLENTFLKKNSAPLLPLQHIENIWIWPQRPFEWLILETSNSQFVLNLYSVEEKEETYHFKLIKKVDVVDNAGINRCVMNFNSLIFPTATGEIKEFNISTLESDVLTIPGVEFYLPLCVFPKGAICIDGTVKVGEKKENSLIISQLKSAEDYKKDCQGKLLAAMDKHFLENKTPLISPILKVVAEYAVDEPGTPFFSSAVLSK